MKEYALLKGVGPARAIVTVALSPRTLEEMKERHQEFEVVPFHDVPARIREAYLYWKTRP